MSSFRNANKSQRRTYKERAQVSFRARLFLRKTNVLSSYYSAPRVCNFMSLWVLINAH